MVTRSKPEPTRKAKGRAPRPGRKTAATSLRAANARLGVYRRRIAALEARVAVLEETLAKEKAGARRRMVRARREFERRLTQMVQAIGELRHHELRAKTFERSIAAKEREIQRLSGLIDR